MTKRIILLTLLLLVSVAEIGVSQPEDLQKRQEQAAPGYRFERRDWIYSQRAHPLGYIPKDAYLRAFRQTEEYKAGLLSASGGGLNDQWVNIGPASIKKGLIGDRVSGRITTIAVDPSNPNHWLIGGALGGVWETTLTPTTGMVNWIPKTDDQPSLAMGTIVFAPGNPNIIYAGTGEATFWSDGYAGAGLLKSTDGGKTWQSLAESTFAGSSFCKIMVDPANSNILTAATNRAVFTSTFKTKPPDHPPTGIFKSTDGGLTWLQKLTGQATHLIGHPQDFNYQYAGIGHPIGSPSSNGLYRSLDGGENWTLLNGPWNTTPDRIGRVELAISPSSPDVVYVSIQDNQQFTTSCTGLWMTRDAWAPNPTWVPLPIPLPDFCVGVADHEITVDPTDPTILYAGGLGLWRYNGASWQDIRHQVHEDQHAMTWAGNRLLLGNDGGIYSTTDGGNTWIDHNGNLSITQFYKGSIHPNNSSFALGGNQDNGAVVTLLPPEAPAWDLLYGGDGFDTAISTTHPETHWAFSLQMMSIFRTTDGAKTYVPASLGIEDDNVPFMTFFEKCPANDDVFIAATYRIWRSDDFFSSAPNDPSWYPNSMDVYWDNITALAFASSDKACQTYAFTTYNYGSSQKKIFLTTNGGQDWIDIDPGKMIPNRYVTGLAFDQVNANVLYLTLSGFDEGTPGYSGHVFKTVNALGGSPAWSNVSPPVNIPHNTIASDPWYPNLVYTGTDIGAWKSTDGGSNWSHMGPETGMPNVAVYDLAISQNGLIAFTHGRGAFQLVPGQKPVCKLSISPKQTSAKVFGSIGKINVKSTSGCSWEAVSNVSWIRLTSAVRGTGTGKVNYSSEANLGVDSRTGTIVVSNGSFREILTVNQPGLGTIRKRPKWIFYDDFNSDLVGNPPSTSPAGNPPDDSLSLQGPPNSIIVVDSGPLGSKAVKIDRTSQMPQAILECIAAGGPHTGGTYVINHKGYSVNVGDKPVLAIEVRSSSGKRALLLELVNGAFRLTSGDGVETLFIGYSVNTVHSVTVRIDMDAAKFWLNLNGTDAALGKKFLDTDFGDLHSLRFEYPAPIVESLPGVYVIDNVTMGKY